MKRITCLIALCCMVLMAQAQNARPNCEAESYRQFDFWVGDWEVWSGDRIVGHNEVELILDECVVMENWTGAGGSKGKSFNRFNRQTGEWEQTWVDNAGGSIFFHGTFADGVMAMKGDGKDRNGNPVAYKLTFWDNEDGTVRQLWEISRGDQEWKVIFDGLYKKKD